MLETTMGSIVLDHWINSQEGGVAGVQFLHEMKSKRTFISKAMCTELGHPL